MLMIKKLVPLSMFHPEKMKFKGFVGIGKIRFRSQWKDQDSLISTIQLLEDKNTHIQIFNCNNVLSPKHLYYGVYFAEQAFALSSNISKQKSMEYLIYTSMQRQIKNAINTTGFLIDDKGHMDSANIVITAQTKQKLKNNFLKMMEMLDAESIKNVILPIDSLRLSHLQNHFHITDFELENALQCMGSFSSSTILEQNEETKIKVFLHVIREKMAQLFMESFKHAQ